MKVNENEIKYIQEQIYCQSSTMENGETYFILMPLDIYPSFLKCSKIYANYLIKREMKKLQFIDISPSVVAILDAWSTNGLTIIKRNVKTKYHVSAILKSILNKTRGFYLDITKSETIYIDQHASAYHYNIIQEKKSNFRKVPVKLLNLFPYIRQDGQRNIVKLAMTFPDLLQTVSDELSVCDQRQNPSSFADIVAGSE